MPGSHISNEIEAKKAELRKRFRFERSQRSLGGDWLHLLRASEISSATTIASYISYGDEPDTSSLNEELRRRGKRVLLPRIDESGRITWIEWDATMKIERHRKRPHLAQPEGNIFSGSIDVVIAPALRVDRLGVRLGQGGGSYDRALKEVAAESSWKVALLHDEEVSAEPLPCEDHDVRMDAVALPEIVVRFKKS